VTSAAERHHVVDAVVATIDKCFEMMRFRGSREQKTRLTNATIARIDLAW
jgi:hypothetical protein